MSRVFDKHIVVKSKDDGTYTIAFAVNDYTVITQTVSEKTLRQLNFDIEKVLEGSDGI